MERRHPWNARLLPGPGLTTRRNPAPAPGETSPGPRESVAVQPLPRGARPRFVFFAFFRGHSVSGATLERGGPASTPGRPPPFRVLCVLSWPFRPRGHAGAWRSSFYPGVPAPVSCSLRSFVAIPSQGHPGAWRPGSCPGVPALRQLRRTAKFHGIPMARSRIALLLPRCDRPAPDHPASSRRQSPRAPISTSPSASASSPPR
jgi:hypothetical protein